MMISLFHVVSRHIIYRQNKLMKIHDTYTIFLHKHQKAWKTSMRWDEKKISRHIIKIKLIKISKNNTRSDELIFTFCKFNKWKIKNL